MSAALEPLIEAGSAARRRQQRVHAFSEQDLSSSTPTSSCGAETSCAAAAGCSQVTLSPDPHCQLPLAFRGALSSMERRQHRPSAARWRGPRSMGPRHGGDTGSPSGPSGEPAAFYILPYRAGVGRMPRRWSSCFCAMMMERVSESRSCQMRALPRTAAPSGCALHAFRFHPQVDAFSRRAHDERPLITRVLPQPWRATGCSR